MLKVETFKNFNGFGTGGQPGEYFYSQGMNKSIHGIVPGWSISSDADSGGLSGLTKVNWFTQATPVSTMYVWAVADDGKIYRSQSGFGSWSLQQTPAETTFGNGLIGDQNGRVLYPMSRYLGMYDGSSWTDNWKDFGASSLPSNSDFRPAETFEDWVIFGNGNDLAVLNITDDSFNVTAFTLPDRFLIRAIKSGRTGLLTGANIGNRGIVFLWDVQATRSLAPWIWLNGNIQGIVPYEGNWLVVTNRKLYITNGYTIEDFADMPDSLADSSVLSVLPQGVEIVGNNLYLANAAGTVNRAKTGLWILNLKTRLWEFVPVSSGATYQNTMGAVFFDSLFRTHISWATTIPNKKHIGHINNAAASKAHLITSPIGSGNFKKVAEGVKLNLGIYSYLTSVFDFNLTVAVKIYDFKRVLWGYAQQKTNSSSHDRITVDGTLSGLNNARVGDEITILEGANAGFVAHITSITGQDSATEVWILDSSFSNDIEANALIQVQPFKLIKKHTLTNLSELKELYFNGKNKVTGQKFLLKILVDNIGSVPVELLEGEFYYDDLGPFTTN